MTDLSAALNELGMDGEQFLSLGQERAETRQFGNVMCQPTFDEASMKDICRQTVLEKDVHFAVEFLESGGVHLILQSLDEDLEQTVSCRGGIQEGDWIWRPCWQI